MNDHSQIPTRKEEIPPLERWCRMVENLREARRQAPIMMDFQRYDGRTRDAAAEAYVTAAEALVIDLGELLEAGILEELSGTLALMQPDLCEEFAAWANGDTTATVELWWSERTPA